ncbi:carbohydrate ABC transporter permease [Arthrobacter agilis]|uniref:carbohydrate ABC transporter permease n=1 Tax=Arthrobacter agilis TaxID=37921 RepID=UPI000B35BF14|nr:carbohydrate ABC transporter permease [Arthrobacter agilis]OUM43564.1 ABC transporter permease [Arthrobacter agilis]PPB47638.1 carbohydrate ABC transporter permease [Arthrobacter agilis]TPV24811.1 carbohydrate ABC transporter permease [Arthrobacter agilis]VDR30954.1 Inner membrane ABC transporter permease protein ycjP [Arthrobacter agilis]
MALVTETGTSRGTGGARQEQAAGKGSGRQTPNVLGGLGGWVWLVLIILPVYYVVITSLKNQSGFFGSNPLAPPTDPTLANYRTVLEADFVQYFVNSVIVTLGSVIPAVAVSFMAAYAVVRGRGRIIASAHTLFLLGLAIPLQATIIPIYFMITRASLYDTLLALILPSIAFAIPISVLILSNFLRDVPRELFESMRLDGCSEFTMMWRLALPLVRPAVVTIAIYNALNVWNGFLFPLILTQSPDKRVLPLSLWAFQDEFTVNIPAVLAAVVLSTLPLVVLYALARRQLVSGLTAGFNK